MRRTVAFVVLLGTLHAADAGDPKAVAKELAKFDGTWKVTNLDAGGPITAMQLTFTKGKLKMRTSFLIEGQRNTDTSDGAFTIDPARTPKTIDWKLRTGQSRGIYEFDKNRLKICFGSPDRPTTFDDDPGKRVRRLILEREKK